MIYVHKPETICNIFNQIIESHWQAVESEKSYRCILLKENYDFKETLIVPTPESLCGIIINSILLYLWRHVLLILLNAHALFYRWKGHCERCIYKTIFDRMSWTLGSEQSLYKVLIIGPDTLYCFFAFHLESILKFIWWFWELPYCNSLSSTSCSEWDADIHKYWDKSNNSISLYAGLVQICDLEETL